jgi:hypothetical protein
MGLIENFWQNMLAKYTPLWYNRQTERDTVRCPTTPLQKEFTMHTFEYNTTEAKIQGLSIQVGELFADLWKQGSYESDNALEAYKSLRRLLPTEDFSDRHVGATAAHKATQGAS